MYADMQNVTKLLTKYKTGSGILTVDEAKFF